MSEKQIIQKVKDWINNFVLGLNLCPFATQPFYGDKIYYGLNLESESTPIINSVLDTCFLMAGHEDIDTAFLILPNIDLTFPSFYDMVGDIEELCLARHYPIRLIAFHPEFKYHDSDINDTANATNRSPFPLIHFIPLSSLEEATSSDFDITEILRRNQEILSKMTWDQIRSLSE